MIAGVAVVVPTVPGREAMLGRCVAALLPGAGAVHVLTGFSACGAAWDAGARLALQTNASHVLFMADDLIAVPGWDAAAIEATAGGELPAPILRDEAGAVWNDQDGDPGDYCSFPRVPFVPRALLRQLLPIPALHYYSDVWVGARAHDLGWKVRVTAGFDFVHLWAQEGRVHDSGPDLARFNAIMARGAL